MASLARISLALTAALAASAAHAATDLACEPPISVTAHRLICESALFSMGYARIFADQQKLLATGAIDARRIDAFRARRDACTSAECLDALFIDWRRESALLKGKSPSR